jgi:surface protein
LNVQDFITVWNLNNPGSSTNSIEFGVGTTGTVNYTWETIPAGTTGSGSFSGATAIISGLPTNAIIRLKIDTTHFNRININNNADKSRLLNIEQWGGVAWSSMESAFYGCDSLNISATDVPDLSLVTNMASMFRDCSSLNSPANMDVWNTSNVTDMSFMFCGAYNFNQPIGNWNTSNVTTMSRMFAILIDFGQSKDFNQPIGNWNTSNVTNMELMFFRAEDFNQPIGSWNTSNVTTMSKMFDSAYNFNQPIGNWNLTALINNQSMLDNCGMDCTNYSSTLNGWANNITNTPNGLNLGALGIQYGTNAVSSRNYLLNTKGWTINGDIANGLVCCIATTSNQSQTACNTYLFNNQTITQSGIYYDTLINSAGCDSMITLNLTINNPNIATTQNGTQLSATATGASYQWLTCNPFTIISGANSQTYTATANGDYAVAVTENGCTDTSNCMTVNSVGIHELNAQNLITISPNPTNSIFKIECPMNGANVILYNSFGQKLLTTKIENQTSLIDISHFTKGIYFAEIKDDKTSYRVKIIKD